jgi:hypothetical protein
MKSFYDIEIDILFSTFICSGDGLMHLYLLRLFFFEIIFALSPLFIFLSSLFSGVVLHIRIMGLVGPRPPAPSWAYEK